MKTRTLLRCALAIALPLAGLGAVVSTQPIEAQRPADLPSSQDAGEARELRQALLAARSAAAEAAARNASLSRQAASATVAEDRARFALARLAARLQAAEAEAGVAEAQLALIEQQRRRIDRNLADRREPLVQLVAALQRMTAQPLALSALQPGSLRQAVYLRAVLDHAVPAIQARTAALRAELERSRQLAAQARLAVRAVSRQQEAIGARRTELLAVAARNRQSGARAASAAQREAQRADDMALAARDLDELVGGFDRMAALRTQLAALPGPVMRPRGGEASGPAAEAPSPAVTSSTPSLAAPRGYRLPVIGRIIGGFGDADASGLARSGLALEPRPEALVVAPAAGRIAFAGPYRGFGMVVIIEHGDGWTSLVTGLATLDTQVGAQIAAGGPLGTAAARRPAISLELRRAGEPVDPLPYALRNP